MSWTDDRISTLKKMWKEGKSAAEIAKVLGKGVTRNAVIGKAHRMGLSGRPSPIKETAAKKKPAAKKAAPEKTVKKETPLPAPKKAAGKKAVPATPARPVEKSGAKKQAAKKPAPGEVAPPHVMEKEDVPPGGGVPLIDLTERMCKWPIGDPRDDDFTFCGLATPQPGMSYCARHAAAAYQSGRRGSAAAAAAAQPEPEDADDVIDADIVDDEDAALDADEDIAAEE